MNPNISILIVDNHPLYIEGLLSCLKGHPLVSSIDICNSYYEMQSFFRLNRPDLVFLELNFGTLRYNGFTVCKEIVSNYKGTFVCILSRYNADTTVRKAQSYGAHAFLDKSITAVTLNSFIDEYSAQKINNYYVRILQEKLSHSEFGESFELLEALTKRERQVFDLILDGVAPKEIQGLLHISYDTYRTHYNSLLSKLGVENDVQLTKLALQHNYTDTNYRALHRKS